MSKEKSFIYLVKIIIGASNSGFIVKNKVEVPQDLLEIMAKEKINQEINKMFSDNKDWKTQTSEHFFNRMIKQSSFTVEDLNQLHVYDLELRFNDKNKIMNT